MKAFRQSRETRLESFGKFDAIPLLHRSSKIAKRSDDGSHGEPAHECPREPLDAIGELLEIVANLVRNLDSIPLLHRIGKLTDRFRGNTHGPRSDQRTPETADTVGELLELIG